MYRMEQKKRSPNVVTFDVHDDHRRWALGWAGRSHFFPVHTHHRRLPLETKKSIRRMAERWKHCGFIFWVANRTRANWRIYRIKRASEVKRPSQRAPIASADNRTRAHTTDARKLSGPHRPLFFFLFLLFLAQVHACPLPSCRAPQPPHRERHASATRTSAAPR